MAAEEARVDWVRRPKRINPNKTTLGKVLEAEKRGISVEVDGDRPDQSTVTKTVVTGIPAPKEKGSR